MAPPASGRCHTGVTTGAARPARLAAAGAIQSVDTHTENLRVENISY